MPEDLFMNDPAIKIPVRKSLSADALISTAFRQFQKISDPRKFSTKKPAAISFTDVLMAGLAVFGLKFPSLLQYDQKRDVLDNNLKALYHVNHFPSDSYLRERLDELDPRNRGQTESGSDVEFCNLGSFCKLQNSTSDPNL